MNWQPATEAQRAALLATEENVLLTGPWGTGKTEVPPVKMLLDAEKHPGIKTFLMQYTANACRHNLWQRTVDWLVERVPSRIKDYHVQEMTFKIRTSSGIDCPVYGGGLKPAEGQVNIWSGREAHRVYLDEAKEVPVPDLYDVTIGRCMRRADIPPQVFLMTNPAGPNHWLHHRFYMEKRAGHRVVEMNTIPRELGLLTPSYYQRLDELTGVFKLRNALGQWVSFEGLVYPFDPRAQILERKGDDYIDGTGKVIVSREQLAGYRCVQAADPGTDHPHVHGWWRVAPEGALQAKSVWFLQRETYMTRRPITSHVKRAVEISRELSVQLEVYYDPAALWAAEEYKRGGYCCREAVNDRLGGQAACYELFPHQDVADPEKITEPRIYFLADALDEVDQARRIAGLPCRTTDEFGGYIWKGKGKEDMVKENDDGMDEMRYAVASCGQLRVPNIGVFRWQS